MIYLYMRDLTLRRLCYGWEPILVEHECQYPIILNSRDAHGCVLTPGLTRKKEPATGWRRTLRMQISEEPRMRYCPCLIDTESSLNRLSGIDSQWRC